MLWIKPQAAKRRVTAMHIPVCLACRNITGVIHVMLDDLKAATQLSGMNMAGMLLNNAICSVDKISRMFDNCNCNMYNYTCNMYNCLQLYE